MNNTSITNYLENGGASKVLIFDDYDEGDELEKLGLFLDQKLKELIRVRLFNPDKTTAFYTSNFDTLTIFIINKRIGTNLFCININNFSSVSYYNYDECDELYFEEWHDLIFYLENNLKINEIDA